MNFLPRIIGALPQSWTEAAVRARWRTPWLKPVINWGASKFKGHEGVIQKGAGKGLLFNPGQSQATYLLGTSEWGVQEVMQAMLGPGKVFYDVGANVGFETVIAARLVDATGHVVCFEPVPDIAALLEYNLRLNNFRNVTVRREALGNSNGEARFLLSAKPTFGKLASTGEGPAEQIGEIPVAVRRLDDMLSELPAPPDLMKIDVEGAEASVLLGASQTIRKVQPFLIIELHGTNAAVAEALEDLGYSGAPLGEECSIRDAHWNAAIIAGPKECTDLMRKIAELQSIPLGMK